MKKTPNNWSQEEFKTYLLLLCAKADAHEHQDEIAMIKSKSDAQIFQNMYLEFENDSEEEAFDKISRSIHARDYSPREIASLKREMHEVFFSDNKFTLMEEQMVGILDNILY